MIESDNGLARELREERAKRHLTLRAAAEQANVHYSIFFRAEKGAGVSDTTLLKLASWAAGSARIALEVHDGQLTSLRALPARRKT